MLRQNFLDKHGMIKSGDDTMHKTRKIINFCAQLDIERDVNMCKILKKIHGRSPEELLKDFDVYDTIPINLSQLAKNIGISVLPMDFSSLEEKLHKKDILGLVLTSGDNAAIFYKKSDSINRIRFTIAHELAHCCHLDPSTKEPHIEYRIDEQDKDSFEREMDIFAGKLLIPLGKLKEVYMGLPAPNSIILADKFAVSVKVMEARLNYLKISHYNSEGLPVIW